MDTLYEHNKKYLQDNVPMICGQVWKIILLLKDVRDDLRNNYKGIGNEYCADSIDYLICRYQKVIDSLNRVNPDVNL